MKPYPLRENPSAGRSGLIGFHQYREDVWVFDPTDELARFLDEHGVHGWVTGEMGQQMLLDHWIDWVLGQCKDVFDSDSASAAERLAALRDMLDKSPDRKTISVKRIREILDS